MFNKKKKKKEEKPEESAEQLPCLSISVGEEPLQQAAEDRLLPTAPTLSRSLHCTRKWVENCDKYMM